jgi:hypothetical protein
MAQVGISQHWLDSFTRYVDRLQQESIERASDTVRYFHEQVQDKARNTPGWEAMADEIEVWSQDGMLYVGIRNKAYVSEAWLIEYGDQESAPNSLSRRLTEQVGLTNEYSRTSAIARYGASQVR